MRGFWAWSALLVPWLGLLSALRTWEEAVLLGTICACWARHLGCVGASAVAAGVVRAFFPFPEGLIASLVAALPAAASRQVAKGGATS